MAISWGSWEYGGGNGMRVGVDVTHTSVDHSSSYVRYTLKFYTENQWRYDDLQTLSFGGSLSGSADYNNTSGTNSSGGGAILRATRTYQYDYPSSSYGSSPGTRTFSATVGGAYNSVTPSVSVNVTLPARPYDRPVSPSNMKAARSSDSTTTLTWTRNATSGEPYSSQLIRRWDNVSEAYSDLATVDGSETSYSAGGTTANRRYRFAVRANNSAGSSSFTYSDFIQTTPAAPTAATVEKSSTTSLVVKWKNNASTLGGYTFSTVVEESVNGGAYTPVATVASSEEGLVRNNLSPGSTYGYRVQAKSTVGATTHSGYATTPSIQLQQPPAAPTGLTVDRVDDGQFTLSWTNHPTEAAPYERINVQQRRNGDAWTNLAPLAGTTSSFSDTSTVGNSRYEWRIRSESAAGASDWVTSAPFQTQPAAPREIAAKTVPGGSIAVQWASQVGYGPSGSFVHEVRHYKNGTLEGSPVQVPGTSTEYTLAQIDPAATYLFEVRVLSTVGYSSQSAWASGVSFEAATVPNAPAISGPSGETFDASSDKVFLWAHAPSEDGSDQTAYEVQTSADNGTTWVSTNKVTSTDSSWTCPANRLANGKTYIWQVRTWGVHETPSEWSPSASIKTSTTPVVTINTPSSTTLSVSALDVSWTYSDGEGTPQARYEIELLSESRSLIEAMSDNSSTTSVRLKTAVEDGKSYVLRLRAFDGDGLSSAWQEMALTADFVPPAEPTLVADYSTETGTTVLSLTPTPDDGGVTTLPALDVDIERRMIDPETGEFGPWATLVKGVPPDANLVDTTAAIAGEGQYRLITRSSAPSSTISAPLTPSGFDDRWVYLSGGQNFSKVCRLMGNVSVRTTASKERALYNFAGRSKPVLYTGDSSERIIEISGLLDGESTPPGEWEALIRMGGVMLLRDPLGHRVYGSVASVSIDRIGGDMYAVGFSITEVDFP